MGDQGQFYMNPFIHTKFPFTPMSNNSQFTGFAKTQIRGSEGKEPEVREKGKKRLRKNMTKTAS